MMTKKSCIQRLMENIDGKIVIETLTENNGRELAISRVTWNIEEDAI